MQNFNHLLYCIFCPGIKKPDFAKGKKINRFSTMKLFEGILCSKRMTLHLIIFIFLLMAICKDEQYI